MQYGANKRKSTADGTLSEMRMDFPRDVGSQRRTELWHERGTHTCQAAAAVSGRGRRQGQRQTGRYIYTGSLNSVGDCTVWRCCSLFSFGLSSISALCGVMLTVFGSTGFFRTADLNNAFLIVGVVLLAAALVLIGIGYRSSMTQSSEACGTRTSRTS